MSQFTGKVAFITGSGRGMGRSHAELLAERGADIIVHDINEEWAEETSRLVRAKGRSALVARADVAKPAAMAEAVRQAEAEVDSSEEMKRYLAQIPLGRYAEPEEMSYAVLFLASGESNFITGQVLSPNGGDTIVGI